MSVAQADPSRHDSPAETDALERPDEPAVGKLAAQVARRIEADVVQQGWPIGVSLGSEPDLRERYGVSRAVFREAVRLVEHHKVARMRRGPNGGLFVTAPDAGPAAQALVIYLEYVGTSLDDLMHARRLLEPLAAGLAAERITEEGITLVRQTVDAEQITDQPEDRSAEGLQVVVGQLSGNPVYQLFIDVLVQLTYRFSEPMSVGTREYRRARAWVVHQHIGIADAIIAGDSGKAEARSSEFLDGLSEWMRTHSRSPASGTARSVIAPAKEGEPLTKLAEVVADRIRDDIAASGWPIGTVFGSESDLLRRYGISRAVLREAVRLLEYHSIARMRRGPGGGLVVGAPDPQASIDTMALYLEYMQVSGPDLVAVRDAIEMGIVTRVTDRHSEPGLAEQLESAVRRMSEGTGSDQSKADHFHTVLADLAGNPVLTLFLRILSELWLRHLGEDPAEVGPVARLKVENVHRRIAEAVLAGDEGIARHRMRRHLSALTEWWH
jgi:DNA-binding FadR family transcriptional regulator